MGTRTYSRRAADGTRKPTALGIRTGKFQSVQEGRTNITGNLPLTDAQQRTINRAAGVTLSADTNALNTPEWGAYDQNGERINGTGLVNYINSFINTRALIEPMPENYTESVIELENALSEFQRSVPLGGRNSATIIQSAGLFPSPLASDILGAAQRGAISTKNAKRIFDAMTDMSKKIPATDATTKAMAVAMIERVGGLLALRSQLYDASVLNPSEGLEERGGISGPIGARIKASLDDVTAELRISLNSLNIILGQPANPNMGGTAPKGTFGAQVQSEMVSGLSTTFNNSANKMARENADLVMDVRRAILALNQAKGINL